MTTFLPPPVDVNVLLAEDEPEYNWCIPGLMERGDRLILTGYEGAGKTVLLRQIAVQCAVGIHPFTLEPMEPQRVLFVDLENPSSLIRRKLAELCVDRTVPYGNLMVARWPSGLDITQSVDREALRGVLGDVSPELLVIGPMYKLAQHLDKEEVAGEVAATLDAWRTVFNFTLIMEAHQPHQTVVDGQRWRAERPIGSSLWMRWPEFGVCLENRGTLRHWRGQRDEREWPDKLYRGEEWPWMVEARLCLHCGEPLKDTQEKYCSEKCGNAARVAKYRASRKL